MDLTQLIKNMQPQALDIPPIPQRHSGRKT